MTAETYAEHCRACKGTGGAWEDTSPGGPRGFTKCCMCCGTGRQSVMTQRKDTTR
jgi:hypothetical protein